jgi:hypothetical protein
MKRILVLLAVAACTRTKATADTTTAASTSATPAALPQGKTQPAPQRPLPKLDTSCNADSDCVVTDVEVTDDPPRTYACCPGCTQRAASASWSKQFQAACAAAPAPMCPPIGCAMLVAKAVCRAHTCELSTK